MEQKTYKPANFWNLAISKKVRQEFNDRMVDITWRYQKKYSFEIRNKKGNEFWNNEADAFKHTFGSALMALEMNDFWSLAGGINHEFRTEKNPEDEWNMDSWNNNQGRKIAKEIKEEFGEKRFKSLSKKEQEDIIAHKVMVKMKNGELITNLNDKRKYSGNIESLFKKTIESDSPKNKSENNKSSSNNNSVHFDKLTLNGKNLSEMSDKEQQAFIEGFDSGMLSQSQGKNWTNKFNTGNPDTDDGHWVTMPNGKHLFIKNS